jgi:hypothetical protein
MINVFQGHQKKKCEINFCVQFVCGAVNIFNKNIVDALRHHQLQKIPTEKLKNPSGLIKKIGHQQYQNTDC